MTAARRALICLPTYNERENLGPITEAILAATPPDVDVLVIDDGSPDGTGLLADELAAREPRVHVLHRAKKEGLGKAYLAGFDWALARDYALVLEMDADFSHDPDSLPEFVKHARDVDVVLGSRYLHGVTVVNWPLNRLILSYLANRYTRLVTGLPLNDATGGYKCFRRRALEGVRLDRVQSDGYSFQIEMSFKCWKKGFTLREIPILFVDRRAGTSKMNRRIIWEAAWMVWKLRLLDLLGRVE